MAGRPGEAAGQRLSPLRTLVEERNREGVPLAASSRLRDDGDSPKPQGRLLFDVADDERCLGDPESQHRLLTPKFSTNIGTWNVHTIHQKGRPELFMREICQYKWDIISLQKLDGWVVIQRPLMDTTLFSLDTIANIAEMLSSSGHDSRAAHK